MTDSRIAALARLLVAEGHMTPEVQRQITAALPAHDAEVAARALQGRQANTDGSEDKR